ncbi:MAG: tetratricopeptide repeat protein [Candidatus Omnitrophica bacterium]|nr:tetratricopeptide repeat protein [Candidatus Omnitrophota bacterium]
MLRKYCVPLVLSGLMLCGGERIASGQLQPLEPGRDARQAGVVEPLQNLWRSLSCAENGLRIIFLDFEAVRQLRETTAEREFIAAYKKVSRVADAQKWIRQFAAEVAKISVDDPAAQGLRDAFGQAAARLERSLANVAAVLEQKRLPDGTTLREQREHFFYFPEAVQQYADALAAFARWLLAHPGVFEHERYAGYQLAQRAALYGADAAAGSQAYAARGAEYAGRREYPAAIIEYLRAAQLAPADPEIRFSLAYALYMAGGECLPPAGSLFSALRQEAPENFQSWYGLGLTTAAQAAAVADPAHARLLRREALDYFSQGWARAGEDARHPIALRAVRQAYGLWREEQDYFQAFRWVCRAVILFQEPYDLYQAAVLLEKQNMPSPARRYYRLFLDRWTAAAPDPALTAAERALYQAYARRAESILRE